MSLLFGANGAPVTAREVEIPSMDSVRACLQLNCMSMDDANDIIADSNGIVQTARKMGLEYVEIVLESRRAAELRGKLQGVFSPRVLKVCWKTQEVPAIGRNQVYTPPQRPMAVEAVAIKHYAQPKLPHEEPTDAQARVERPKPTGRPPNPSKMSPDLLRAREQAVA